MDQMLSLAPTMGDDPDVKRDVLIKVLVTKDERDAMKAAASKEGLNISEWIRRRCFRTTTITTIEVTAPDMSDPLHAMTGAQKKRMLTSLAKPAKKGGR